MNVLRFTRTATFRLALIYVASFGLATLILFTFLFYKITNYSYDQIRNSIHTEILLLISDDINRPNDVLKQLVNDHAAAAESTSSYYLLQDQNGQRIAGNIAPLTPRHGFYETSVFPIRGHSSVTALMQGMSTPDGGYLAVGQDLDDLHMLNREVGQALIGAGAAIAVLAMIGGSLLSVSFVRRIENINRTTETIIRGQLDQRITASGSQDEIERLGHNLNRMLDQIQDLMERVRRVSSDVAHDLCTPLTRLRHRLERVRARPSTICDYEREVDACIAETDEILSTSAALLRISEVEAGRRIAAFRNLNLSNLFDMMQDIYAPVLEDAGQRLEAHIEPGLFTFGDRELLTQMLVNLIENAVRHCPEGNVLTLDLFRDAAGPHGVIRDTGPGIPAAERERVFQRFHRLERSRTTPGSGLGLALVKAIADLHAIRLSLADAAPGAAFHLFFPPPTTGAGLTSDGSHEMSGLPKPEHIDLMPMAQEFAPPCQGSRPRGA